MAVMFDQSFLMTGALCLGTLLLLFTVGPQILDALRTGKAVTGIGVFSRKKQPAQYWALVVVFSGILFLMLAASLVNLFRLKSPF